MEDAFNCDHKEVVRVKALEFKLTCLCQENERLKAENFQLRRLLEKNSEKIIEKLEILEDDHHVRNPNAFTFEPVKERYPQIYESLPDNYHLATEVSAFLGFTSVQKLFNYFPLLQKLKIDDETIMQVLKDMKVCSPYSRRGIYLLYVHEIAEILSGATAGYRGKGKADLVIQLFEGGASDRNSPSMKRNLGVNRAEELSQGSNGSIDAPNLPQLDAGEDTQFDPSQENMMVATEHME